MTKVHELKIRPVTRYALTEFKSEAIDGRERSGSRQLGEFPNEALAIEVALAVRSANPGATLVAAPGQDFFEQPLEFVIVRAHTYAPENTAHFAYSAEDARRLQAELQQETGGEYRIFSRPYNPNDPAPPAPIPSEGKPHTQYPSRYAIGDMVVRCAVDARDAPSGMLLAHEAELAEVYSVHFYPGKVTYEVTYPSGRTMERVDSIELSDPPVAIN